MLLLHIHASKFRKLVWPAAAGMAIVFFGLLGWAINANDGGLGHLLKPKIHLAPTQKAFTMLYGITSGAGSFTAFGTRYSDWTRFSKNGRTYAISTAISIPIFQIVSPLLGVLVTSAVYSRYGVVQWNPLILLLYLQQKYYTPVCRAATFFAGLALFYGLIMVGFIQYTSITLSKITDS